MIYNAARVRRLSTKFQVNTSQNKVDLRMQLHTLLVQKLHTHAKLRSEQKGSYVQNFKSIYAKLKKIALSMRSCAPCS